MGDPPKENKGGVEEGLEKVVVAAFELTGETLKNAPQLAEDALKSKEVRQAFLDWAVKETVSAVKKGDGTSGGSIIVSGDANEAGKRLLESLGESAKDEVIKKIKETPEFKRLEGRVDKLKELFEKSPTGVFVEKNKTWLIISGILAGVGGVTLLYVAKTGDKVLSLAEGKDVKIAKLGKIEFRAGATKLEPSTTTLGANVIAKGKWDNIEAKVELSGVVSGKNEYVQVGGKAELEYTPNKDTSFKFTLDANTYKLTPLAFGNNKPLAGLDPGARDRPSWSFSAAASVKWKISPKGDLSMSLGTTIDERWVKPRFDLGYNYHMKGLDLGIKGGLFLDRPLGDSWRGPPGTELGKDPIRPGMGEFIGGVLWF